MKTHLLTGLLAVASLASCSKKEDATPVSTTPTPAPPVTVQAFTATTGNLAIDTKAAPPSTLLNLQLQIVSQDNGDRTVTFFYTWRGHMPTSFYTLYGQMPAGTGIEVRAKFLAPQATPLASRPGYAEVKTYTTDPDFSNPKGLDLAGAGLLTQTAGGYTLPFTAQFISGSLTP
jgi:hypothetical protein